MKIAITSSGTDLESQVDPRFGRCSHFIVIDTDTLEFKAVPNTGAAGTGGAGIAAGQTVVNEGVKAVLTGDCGPNAYRVLEAAGIEIITGVSGKVRDAAEAYREGKYKSISGPSVPPHHGMK